MFNHIVAYRLKVLLRDKETMFWVFAFPLILATLFRLTFANIGAEVVFQPIDIAIVDADPAFDDTPFLAVVQTLATGEERLFNAQATDQANAETLLAENKIDAYILLGGELELVVLRSGIEQSIVKSLLDHYLQTSAAINRISETNPGAIPTALALFRERLDFTADVPLGRVKPDFRLIYFYALLAMATLQGGFFGVTAVSALQADSSAEAVRQNLAPIHKLKLFMLYFMVACALQSMVLLVKVAYLVAVLGIDFGTRLGLVVATVLIGSVTGVSLGTFVAALVRGTVAMKDGIVVVVTMIWSSLAGMMSPAIKDVVVRTVPPLAYLNPANLLTDAFYALYYFDTYSRYLKSIVGLSVFAFIFCLTTYLVLRRQRYASI